jgi:hypothetical protein
MTNKEHEHKYTFTKIESCTLEPRETIEYYTRQCTICGLCPTTDFNKYRMRPEECAECRELVRAGKLLQTAIAMPECTSKDRRYLIAIYKMAFNMHQQAAHPDRIADDVIE